MSICDEWITGDMSVAAYVKSKGKKLLRVNKKGHNEFVFYFDDSDKRCDELAVSFLESESYLFDVAVRTIKKICFSKHVKIRVDNT